MKISDDEAIAVAASCGAAWSVPLPTVRIDRPEEFGAAVLRGARALQIRNLVVTAEGQEPQLAAELSDLVRGMSVEPMLAAQIVRADSPEVAVAGGLLVAPVGNDEVFVDLISPIGVHDVEVVPRVEAERALMEHVRLSFDWRPDDIANRVELHLTLGSSTIVVRPGEVQFGDGRSVQSWPEAESICRAELAAAFAR